MAVYEANLRSLAQFISDTKLGFAPAEIKSTTGYRTNGSRYIINVHNIKCDRIYVENDCFIDTEGNVVVISYVPAIKYFLISNELSNCYENGRHLSFEYQAKSQVLRFEFGKETEIKSYDDFEKCLDHLVSFIGQNIEEAINEFAGNSWVIENVVCDITWQVDRIKKG